MDANFLTLNQMSYQQQQFLSNRTNKNHYSNRQQQQQHHQLQQRLASQQHQRPDERIVQKAQVVNSSTGSSASENDDHPQFSSNSTATNKTASSSSRQAMLSHGAKAAGQHQHHQMMHHQQQQQQQQHQKQRQQQHHGQPSSQHRQVATMQQQLMSNGGGGKNGYSKANAIASIDNMTTSSSDHTIDDLHQLAHGSYGQHHRLGAGRYGAEPSQSGGRFLLGVLFTLSELLLFTTVLLWIYWAFQHDDGLAWQSERKQQFNTHAALMLFGFVFLNGQAMLIYRSFQCCSKIYTKILHTILFVLATSAISLGLILGYTAQENVGASNKPIMHFYSLHAWCGLATVGLFVFQFVFGFVSFLILLCCDNATSKFRAALLPIHKTFGLIIFGLAISTCLTGLLQTARSRLSSKLNKVDYHELGEAGIIINLIGVCLICLAILMPYIIRNLDIKRPVRSELDRQLKLSQLDMRM